jgi:hypothetical protein
MSNIFGTASMTNGKPRRIEGLPLIYVKPYHRPSYYVTTDGRYELHGGPDYRSGWDNGAADYWAVDTLTGEPVMEYLPPYSYTARDPLTGELVKQHFPGRVMKFRVSGFRNAVRRLRAIIESESMAS